MASIEGTFVAGVVEPGVAAGDEAEDVVVTRAYVEEGDLAGDPVADREAHHVGPERHLLFVMAGEQRRWPRRRGSTSWACCQAGVSKRWWTAPTLNSTSGTSRGLACGVSSSLDGVPSGSRNHTPRPCRPPALGLGHPGPRRRSAAGPKRWRERHVVQLLRGCLDHTDLLLVAAGAAGHQPATLGCRFQAEAAKEVVGDVEAGHGQGVVVQTGDRDTSGWVRARWSQSRASSGGAAARRR